MIGWLLAGLHHVPDVVWAALIAALVAFISTVLSNRNSRKQLEMQLNNNAQQRDRDRAMSIRRDVYLPAAEAVARAQGALGQLTDVSTDQGAIGRQLVVDLATMAKIHLVASESTVTALMNYQKALMPAYFQIIELRGPLVARQRSIELLQTYMDAAITEHQRLVQLMKDHNISGSADGAPLQRLDLQCENELKLHKDHAEQKAALMKEQNAAQLNIAEKLTELMIKTSTLIPDTIISARQDLDLPIDQDEFRRLYAEQQKAAQDMLRDVVDRGRKLIAHSASSDTNQRT